ncbi:TPA: hypothetical protein MYM12_000600 [Klebsiella pneumoniae]|nr:hypothetical protein [Klebsiella pneumoniae]
MDQITDERLVKILSETQATIMEHNSRCVRGSVEVDARLFESMIMELQVRRKAAEGYKNLNEMEQRAEQAECLIMCLDDLGVPDTEGSESLSLWGRVKIFAEENSKDRAELQERRKADSEPVAEVVSIYGDPEAFGEREIRPLVGIQQMPYGTKLYRHAQPVPVVSADLLHTAASAIEDLLEHTDPNTNYYSGVWADVPGKLRAAMFQAKSLTGNSPVIGIDLASGPDRTVEVHYVAPPGYVMVPKEPTEAMMLHNSGCQHHAWDDPDCAMRQTRRLIWSHMLAAAPQEVK